MTLTSQIKELGAIYTFGIKKLIKSEPGRIQAVHDDKHLDGFDGDADVLTQKSQGLGSGQRNNGNEMFSQELEMRKRSRFKLCLVKRKIQISYKLKI